MLKKRVLVIISSLLFTTSSVFGEEAALVATVDKTNATLQDQIILTLSVRGVQRAQAPILPRLPDFDVHSRGSSTRMQIVNRQISSSVDSTYALVPKKEGTFVIGPATVNVDGKTYTSTPITVTIASVRKRPEGSQALFTTARVDKENPHVGEQVIYTLKFFRAVRVRNAQLQNPSFDGFLVEKVGKEREYQTVVGGRTYMVTELKQALFPTRQGRIEIAPARLRCEVVRRSRRGFGLFDDPFFDDSFFGFGRTEVKTLQTSPLVVEAKPLPQDREPPDFTNLVGTFALFTQLSKKSLEVGDTTTLTLAIQGKGNIREAQEPKIPDLPDFKIYDDKPMLEVNTDGDKFGGTLTLKKALVPLKAGRLTIPPITLSYFNPETGRYEQAASTPIVLKVSPSSEKEKLHLVEAFGTQVSKEEVKLLGRDILPLATSLHALEPETLNPFSLWFAVSFLIPIAGYLSAMAVRRRTDKSEKDQISVRSRTALRNFQRRFSQLKVLARDEGGEEFFRLTAKALRDFLGDKLNKVGGALTSKEVEQELRHFGVEGQDVDELNRIFGLLESGQFGFRHLSRKEREDLLREARHMVKRLNRKLNS